MGQRSDEIKKHIDAQRSELSENLERLEERVKSTTDWRTQVEKRPMTALGIAFGSGLLLGALVPIAGRRSGASKYQTSDSTSTQAYGGTSQVGESYTGQGYTGSSEGTTGGNFERRPARRTATSREIRRTWDILDTVRGALVSFGAAKLRDYLGSAIPGFDDHYKRTEEEHRRDRGYSTEAGYSSQGYSRPGMTETGTATGTSGTTGTSSATPR